MKKAKKLLKPGQKVEGLDFLASIIVDLMETRDQIDVVIGHLAKRREKDLGREPLPRMRGK